MNYLMALDINQKVEMLEEICSKERDKYWCKLEVSSIYLGPGAAGELKRDGISLANCPPSEDALR